MDSLRMLYLLVTSQVLVLVAGKEQLMMMSDGDRSSDIEAARRNMNTDNSGDLDLNIELMPPEYRRSYNKHLAAMDVSEGREMHVVTKPRERRYSRPTTRSSLGAFERSLRDTPSRRALLWSDEIEDLNKIKDTRRIRGPDGLADITEYPFIAAILMFDKFWCAGVIIDLDLILTVANCLQIHYNNRFFREYVKMVTVRVGTVHPTRGGQMLNVSTIYFHPNYKSDTLENNLALLRLEKPMVLGETVKEIEIDDKSNFYEEQKITFLGWGAAMPGYAGGMVPLQKVELPIYDHADCADIYGKEYVTKGNFCAGYSVHLKNVCSHDGGGPAISDDKLVGILSFSSASCNSTDRPAVFTSTLNVPDWIDSLTNKPSRF